jgi:hypothetical protein
MGTGSHTLRREDRPIPDTQMSPTQGGSNVATAERIRVLVADDEETVRDVLEALLGSEPEIDLIGLAADTETAIELACKDLPDVAPGGCAYARGRWTESHARDQSARRRHDRGDLGPRIRITTAQAS